MEPHNFVAEVKAVLPCRYEGLFILDKSRKIPFLLDSGSSNSILPYSLAAEKNLKITNNETKLKSVTGDPLEIVGRCSLDLDLAPGLQTTQEFIVARIPISYGILGFDFMRDGNMSLSSNTPMFYLSNQRNGIELTRSRKDHESVKNIQGLSWAGEDYSLITNPAGEHVDETTDSEDNAPFSVESSRTMDSKQTHDRETAELRCRSLLDEFPELTSTPDYKKPCPHQFTLDIELTDYSPVIHKPRRCSEIDRKIVAENFKPLLEKGVVVRSSSYYASPITLVKKRNGSSRTCVDYTQINSRTKTLNYPLPLISSLQTLIKEEHKYFTVLDLKDAFHSLPLTPRASKIAGITTLEGLFLPLRTPFGLKNGPSKFCEMMATAMEGLTAFIFNYLDDFLIYSRTLEDPLSHIRQLLNRLKNFGLFVNTKKCVFAKDKVTFLGYEISTAGIRPLHQKISLVSRLEEPQTMKELRRFLGIISYYRSHIKDLASNIKIPD